MWGLLFQWNGEAGDLGCDWDGHVPDWLSRVMKMWRRSVPVESLLAGDTSLPDPAAGSLPFSSGVGTSVSGWLWMVVE
jgi:hypothetical protein